MIQELQPVHSAPSKPRQKTTPPSLTEQSDTADRQILALYQGQKWDEACSLLYQIYYKSIHKIVNRRLRGWFQYGGLKEQSEDVAMEALHRVHASLRRQSEDARIHEIQILRAWILRTVSWQCLTAIQKRKNNKELLNTEDNKANTDPEDTLFSEQAIIEQVDGHKRLQALRACALEIESRVGQALRLWLTGLTYAQVASQLGYKSLGSVHGAIQAATKKVRKCLAKKGWSSKSEGGAQ